MKRPRNWEDITSVRLPSRKLWYPIRSSHEEGVHVIVESKNRWLRWKVLKGARKNDQ